MEVGFVDQCVEYDAEPIEKLVDVVVEIPNLVYVGIEIGFHDQLVTLTWKLWSTWSYQVVEGDDPYVADMNVFCMDVAGVDSLVVDVVEDLHDTADLYVSDVELLVVDIAKGLHVSLDENLSLHFVDMDFMSKDIVVAGCDQIQRLLVRHYGSKLVDWMVEILVVHRWLWIWMTCMLVLLSLLKWKPLVKMKMVANISSGIKV